LSCFEKHPNGEFSKRVLSVESARSPFTDAGRCTYDVLKVQEGVIRAPDLN